MKTIVHQFGGLAAAVAVLMAAALGLASSAGAIGGPGGDPPPIKEKPNLFIAGSVAPFGTSEWELRYTVSNTGNAAAGAFRVVTQQNGGAQFKNTYYSSLAAGTSRSEVIHIPRSDCYIPVRFIADASHQVAESSETDNERLAVGLASTTCPTQPRYTVKAVSFHANDETGIDWLGSDEPYWIFNGVGAPGTEHSTASHVFGDIDTGDTAYFSATEGCMYLSCAGGAAPNGMGFSVQLWEEDLGYVSQTLTDEADAFRTIGGVLQGEYAPLSWLGYASVKMADVIDYINSLAADDLVGTQTWTYSPVYLASRLPAAGQSFTDTRTYTGGGGEYTMTVQVTRTA
jgi:hypothetical protein